MRSDSSVLVYSILTMALVLITGVGACSSCTLINPGHIGLEVNRSGANRGVQDMPIVSGWVSYNPITETIVEFPTTTQTVIWTQNPHEGQPADESITFSSREGVTVSSDVALSYHVDPAHAGRLYTRFRTTDLEQLTNGYVRNLARDALNENASQLPIQEIYGAGKTHLLEQSLAWIRSHLGADGFIVDQLSFQGALRLPPNVVDAINRGMQATQDAITAQNRVAQVTAEAHQREAEAEGAAAAARTRAQGDADALLIRTRADAQNRQLMATADAEANRTIAASLTPEVIRYRQLMRWDGRLPTVQGTGSMPMLQLEAGR